MVDLMSLDPSLARPGANLTGVAGLSPDIAGKRLELLRELVPSLAKVAVLWNPANPLGAPQLNEARTAARTLGVQLQVLEVRRPAEFDGSFAEWESMAAERARAAVVMAQEQEAQRRAR